MKLPELSWSSVEKGLQACDLRFEDPGEEAAFKKSVEPELLRWTLITTLTATSYTIFHEAFYTGPSALAGDQNEHFQDIRYHVFVAQVVLWTVIPALLCSLVALRVIFGFLSRWNWEMVVNCIMMYAVTVLVVGQSAFMTRLSGEDPDKVWQQTFYCSVEAWVLMGLDIVITTTAFLFPIRTVLLWTVPCIGMLTYLVTGAVVHEEGDNDMFPLKFLAILALSVLAWSGALRNERHLRTAFVALQQVSKAEDKNEIQQCSINSMGQEILEKDALIEETTRLVQSLQTVMTAVCETMVLLSPTLEICNTTASHDLFFERPVEGELFTSLFRESDVVRLQEALSQVSDRHVPACLPVTLYKKFSVCEVTLLIADRGPQSQRVRYLVGVRMDREVQTERKISGDRIDTDSTRAGSVSARDQSLTAREKGERRDTSSRDLPNHISSDEEADDEAGSAEVGSGGSESCDEAEEGYVPPPPPLPPILPPQEGGSSSSSHRPPRRKKQQQQQEEHQEGQPAAAGDDADDDNDQNNSFQSVVPDPNRTSSFPLPSISEDSESDFEGLDNTPANLRATYPLNKKKRQQQFANHHNKKKSEEAFTHTRSRARTIRMVMRRWHVKRNITSCCHFHTAARSIDEAVEYLMAQPCDTQWEALKNQCPRCTCMNSNGACLVCGMEGKKE